MTTASHDSRLSAFQDALDSVSGDSPLGPVAATIRSLLEAGPAVLRRDHFDPGHVTASAFVLSPDESELLLIRHAKLGMWLQPGGHVEVEDLGPVEAAQREVAEETTLRELELILPVVDLDVHVIPQLPPAPTHQHFDVRALFRAKSWQIRGDDGVLDARWFSLETLSRLTAGGPLAEGWSTDESVLKVARRLGRGLLSRERNR